MKAKLLFIIFSILICFELHAQVGVGTTDPQKELHVAGANSTIRIDGLNETNNSNNQGGTNTYPLHVNSDGDLVIPSAPASISQLVNITNPMSSVINVQTTSNSGVVSQELYSQSFTVTKAGLAFINYNLSFSIRNFDNTGVPVDGRAKIIQSWVHLGNGTTPNTSTFYGYVGQSYTNSTGNTAFGFLYNNGTGIVYLTPGTYSIHVYGLVYGGNLTSDAAFSANFGVSSGTDYLSTFIIH